MIRRIVTTVKRSICVLLLLVSFCLLVLFQAIQLPAANSNSKAWDFYEDLGNQFVKKNLSRWRGYMYDADNILLRTTIKPYFGPVPSVCVGSDTQCLEGLLLSPPNVKTMPYNEDQRLIPAIIHLIVLNEPLLTNIANFIDEWHRYQQNWTYVVWTKVELHQMVKRFYPKFLGLVADTLSIKEANLLIKMLILQKYGGFIIEASDLKPVASIEFLRWLPAVFFVNGDLWAAQNASIDSRFLTAARGHPFVQYCIDQALHKSALKSLSLTDLLLSYSTAFPSIDRPQHSLHLARLTALLSATGSRKISITNSIEKLKSSHKTNLLPKELHRMFRQCEIWPDKSRVAVTASPHRRVTCPDLLNIRNFLEANKKFLVPRTENDLVPKRQVRSTEQLSIRYPLVNVGLQTVWRVFP